MENEHSVKAEKNTVEDGHKGFEERYFTFKATMYFETFSRAKYTLPNFPVIWKYFIEFSAKIQTRFGVE